MQSFMKFAAQMDSLRATAARLLAALQGIRSGLEESLRATSRTPFWIAPATSSRRAGASVDVLLPQVRGPSSVRCGYLSRRMA